MSEPLEISLLVGKSLAQWEVEAIEKALTERNITISLVVHIETANNSAPLESIHRVAELREWAPIAGLCSILERFRGPIPQKKPVPVEEISFLEECEHIRTTPERIDGWKIRPSEEIAQTVGAQSDVALFFTGGFLMGPILTAPTHGVLGFHHGDIRKYRGQPAGFWEFVNNEPEGGVTLQRYTETLDGGAIIDLKPVPIADADTWREVRKRLYEASKDMFLIGVARLQDDSFYPYVLPEEQLGEMYTLPKGYPVLKYLLKTLYQSSMSQTGISRKSS
jgi:hypothetical protein